MTGGIRFDVTAAPVRDEFGNPVMCTLCGGTLWDITALRTPFERVECSAPACGQPVTAAADGAPGAAAETATGG